MDDIIRLCTRYIKKKLLNVYCEIFGTRSYGGDALASSCVLRHMNSCRIFDNIHSITYKNGLITIIIIILMMTDSYRLINKI